MTHFYIAPYESPEGPTFFSLREMLYFSHKTGAEVMNLNVYLDEAMMPMASAPQSELAAAARDRILAMYPMLQIADIQRILVPRPGYAFAELSMYRLRAEYLHISAAALPIHLLKPQVVEALELCIIHGHSEVIVEHDYTKSVHKSSAAALDVLAADPDWSWLQEANRLDVKQMASKSTRKASIEALYDLAPLITKLGYYKLMELHA